MRRSPSALTLLSTAIAAALAVVVDESGQFPGPGAAAVSRAAETVGSREVTELAYASGDGRKIPAVLSMPSGDGPFPVVVTIHGGRGNRDLAFIHTLAVPGGISPTVTRLNEQPCAILPISYRAGGGAVLGMEQDDVVATSRRTRDR
jgi:hypothetical protein